MKLNKIALLSFILLSSTFSMHGRFSNLYKLYKPALVGLLMKKWDRRASANNF
jgi:hypothetical protein